MRLELRVSAGQDATNSKCFATMSGDVFRSFTYVALNVWPGLCVSACARFLERSAALPVFRFQPGVVMPMALENVRAVKMNKKPGTKYWRVRRPSLQT